MIADDIRAELDQLGADATTPGLAAMAIALAESFDETEAPTSRAVVARELNALMKTVRALAPVGEEGDVVDDLAARREKRRGA
ncbi:hypothetical protein [Streptomyces thermolilacinus]|uniref:hypothetical protein n=1 Tax=Streptomyces thermolilacinus TaxID=285540 RepID=UPI0033D497A0